MGAAHLCATPGPLGPGWQWTGGGVLLLVVRRCRYCGALSSLSLVRGGHVLCDQRRALVRDTRALWPSGWQLRGAVGSPGSRWPLRTVVAIGAARGHLSICVTHLHATLGPLGLLDSGVG